MDRWWLLYLCIGVGLAVLCDRKATSRHWAGRVGAGCLCTSLWPLWAPVVLLPGVQEPAARATQPFVERIEHILREAQRSIADTPLATLLPAQFVARLVNSVRLVERRHYELQALLARPEHAPASAGAGARQQTLQRLTELREQDERTLQELCALAEALHLQLLLARFSGASADGARDLALELGTQVESLDEWLTLGEPLGHSGKLHPLSSA